MPPYRQPRLHLARGTALEDSLLCTPAIREIKRRNPSCHVTFYTRFPQLIAGLPFIDAVRPLDERPDGTIDLGWDNFHDPDYLHGVSSLDRRTSRFPRRHLARIIGDLLGVDVQDVRPSCVLDPVDYHGLRAGWQYLPRPWIVVNRHASGYVPNKEWPQEHWETLVDGLLSWASVIEIGGVPVRDAGRDPGRYLSLISRQSVSETVATIAAADLHVGPSAWPIHVAAAFGVRSVVIYGGREAPECTAYDENIPLGSPLPCSPCWLGSPCPYDRKCLRQIAPATVDAALRRAWAAEDRSGSRPPG